MPDQTDSVVRRVVAAPNCVTIFGGGVAGLTAAHELSERGFRVQVWEPHSDPRKRARGAELGGMARTQWVAAPWPSKLDAATVAPLPATWRERRTHPVSELPQTFLADVHGNLQGALGRFGRVAPSECARELFADLIVQPHVSELYCEVCERGVREGGSTRTADARKVLADKIVGWLSSGIGASPFEVSAPAPCADYPEILRSVVQLGERRIALMIVSIDEFPEDAPREYELLVGFRARERSIPGEHGFRFFPAFYHHVFDTMNRTPILEPVPKLALSTAQERAVTVNAGRERYTETGRSVFENLHPTSKMAIGFADKRWPAEFSRSLPRSFEELYEWVRLAFEGRYGETTRGLGLTPRDTTRFQLKVVQFLTSGPKRRAHYEKITWLDFLGGPDVFSARFLKAVSDWPEALVAMQADEVDARTHGAILGQLLLDNLRPASAYRDGTLNGPTGEAWIKPWKRYLEAQGVEFIHGRLEGFRTVTAPNGDTVLWPKVECYEPRYPNAAGDPPLLPGYFVLALPAREAQRVALSYAQHSEAHPDLRRLAKQRAYGSDAELSVAKPAGQLRHMIGIQYYFDEDISWLDGHAYFPGSPWGLSSISQVRFWQERHDWEHGYRGILSVVISVFDQKFSHILRAPNQPERVFDKTAWECTPEEMAEAAWLQIKMSLGNTVPEPRYWHIDDDLRFEQGSGAGHFVNTSPYQINLPGHWEERPGDLEKPAGERYSAYDGIVCAGTHMKTFTRLTTMEAANESARHAVNAILADGQAETRKSPCAIWPIEEREIVDLKLLHEIDDELCERGQAHFIEILGIDELVTYGLRGGEHDPLGPTRILKDLWALLRAGS